MFRHRRRCGASSASELIGFVAPSARTRHTHHRTADRHSFHTTTISCSCLYTITSFRNFHRHHSVEKVAKRYLKLCKLAKRSKLSARGRAQVIRGEEKVPNHRNKEFSIDRKVWSGIGRRSRTFSFLREKVRGRWRRRLTVDEHVLPPDVVLVPAVVLL